MVALLLTASTAAYLVLPALLSFVSLDNEAGIIEGVTNVSSLVVGSLLHAAILINVLITVANRDSDDLSPTTWFLVLALVAKIFAGLIAFFGELGDSTQTVWMAEHVLTGWVPLALIFGLAYHIIPYTTGSPIWSESMLKVNMALLFVTVPPFFMTAATSAELLQNLGAILLTLGMLPLFAGSVNLLVTAKSNAAAVVKSPGAFAATGAMLLLPIYTIGGYFTSRDVFVGLGNLGFKRRSGLHVHRWRFDDARKRLHCLSIGKR
jgi:cbb3-type cytochrome oxidase subunit 1